MTLYVYGLMRAREARAAVAAGGAGESAPAVRAVMHDGLAALVSELPEGRISLRRESLTAHADVLQAAFAHGPVLPLRFGTVMAGRAAVAEGLLAPHRARMLERLEALSEMAELQVRAIYEEAPLLRSVLASDGDLRRRAQRLRRLPAAATHFERIGFGEALAGAVAARRAADAQVMLGPLSEHAVAVEVGEPQHERMALAAAFLVARERLGAFDAAVERVSASFGPALRFRLIGPLPPYSFVAGMPSGASGSVAWA